MEKSQTNRPNFEFNYEDSTHPVIVDVIFNNYNLTIDIEGIDPSDERFPKELRDKLQVYINRTSMLIVNAITTYLLSLTWEIKPSVYLSSRLEYLIDEHFKAVSPIFEKYEKIK